MRVTITDAEVRISWPAMRQCAECDTSTLNYYKRNPKTRRPSRNAYCRLCYERGAGYVARALDVIALDEADFKARHGVDHVHVISTEEGVGKATCEIPI
jgi:hypothetical protein